MRLVADANVLLSAVIGGRAGLVLRHSGIAEVLTPSFTLEAQRRIGDRDPEDADVLALALHLRVPVWSNDRDFERTGVERYTTAQ